MSPEETVARAFIALAEVLGETLATQTFDEWKAARKVTETRARAVLGPRPEETGVPFEPIAGA
jgi:hypothetical protein